MISPQKQTIAEISTDRHKFGNILRSLNYQKHTLKFWIKSNQIHLRQKQMNK